MSGTKPCPFCNGTGIARDTKPLPSRELRWTVAVDKSTGSHVIMEGEITEQANLESLLTLARPVVLELAGVSYVNTMGSHALVRLVEALGGAVTVERCSPAIVRQLNLVPALSDSVRVRSALVPYTCEVCQVDHPILVALREQRPSPPDRRCGTCNNVLTPDESINSYFAFMPR